MRRFKFRLEALLWHRLHLEDSKATLFRLAQTKRLDAEVGLARTRDLVRRAVACDLAADPERLRQRDLYLERLADRVVDQQQVIAVLTGEEESARQEWLEARRKREVVEKLKEKALARHRAAELSLEQRDLDEWAILRRGAAHAN